MIVLTGALLLLVWQVIGKGAFGAAVLVESKGDRKSQFVIKQVRSRRRLLLCVQPAMAGG